MLLFILCSLTGWLCPLPEPAPAVAPISAEVPTAEIEPASFSGIGNPFVGLTEKDDGYCGDDLSGSGWSGSLLWPLEGEVGDGRAFRVGHTAIDINGEVGQPVRAAAFGRVVYAGWSGAGFGNLVVLAHGGGWLTFYGHLSAVSVECGEFVAAGRVIGGVGRTGAATWVHLHFEVRRGRVAFDPMLWLR
jgi:murein DD-endopeptidase MepM/ murein hydrolase activator NlpD